MTTVAKPLRRRINALKESCKILIVVADSRAVSVLQEWDDCPIRNNLYVIVVFNNYENIPLIRELKKKKMLMIFGSFENIHLMLSKKNWISGFFRSIKRIDPLQYWVVRITHLKFRGKLLDNFGYL